MSFETVLNLIDKLGSFFTFLVAIAFMFIFWEPIAQKIGWKKLNGNGNGYGKLSDQMATLANYYNHDTSKKLDDIHDGIKDMARTLAEIKEYGLPCRD